MTSLPLPSSRGMAPTVNSSVACSWPSTKRIVWFIQDAKSATSVTIGPTITSTVAVSPISVAVCSGVSGRKMYAPLFCVSSSVRSTTSWRRWCWWLPWLMRVVPWTCAARRVPFCLELLRANGLGGARVAAAVAAALELLRGLLRAALPGVRVAVAEVQTLHPRRSSCSSRRIGRGRWKPRHRRRPRRSDSRTTCPPSSPSRSTPSATPRRCSPRRRVVAFPLLLVLPSPRTRTMGSGRRMAVVEDDDDEDESSSSKKTTICLAERGSISPVLNASVKGAALALGDQAASMT